MNWCYFEFSTAIEGRDISHFVGIPPLCFVDFHLFIYTIRLKFSNFFIYHYFQNQMFENFKYALNMSSDAQIHVSRRVCVLFSRPRVAALRLKNHANHVPSIPRASHVINFCLL